MSERREPGWYIVRVRKEREDFHIGEVVGSLIYFADKSEWPVSEVAEWGPRILPDPTLVQVSKEELKKLRELEYICRHPDWQPGAALDVLDRLDSLRRREGES